MYTMKDVCDMYHMPYETLRFYCNEGLIPNIKRDQNNYRIFNERDLAWIHGVQCLRKCGLSIKDLKVYLNLVYQGESSIQERKLILERQKAELLAKKTDIESSLAYIEQKQSYYDDVLSGKIEYRSNIISTT